MSDFACRPEILGKMNFSFKVTSIRAVLAVGCGLPPDCCANVFNRLIPRDFFASRCRLVVEANSPPELDDNGARVREDIEDGGFATFECDETRQDAASCIAQRLCEGELCIKRSE